MREECKHFQSRTYASGRWRGSASSTWRPRPPGGAQPTARRYERRLADAGWVHGTLIEPAIEDEPSLPGEQVAEVLGHAEDIVNAIAAEAVAEARAEDARRERSRAARSGGGAAADRAPSDQRSSRWPSQAPP